MEALKNFDEEAVVNIENPDVSAELATPFTKKFFKLLEEFSSISKKQK